MNREQRIGRILDLLGRPEERRGVGYFNLAALDDARLDEMLKDLEQDAQIIAETVDAWLKPISDAASSAVGFPGQRRRGKRGSTNRPKKEKFEELDDEKIPIAAQTVSENPEFADQIFYWNSDSRSAVSEVKQVAFEHCLTLQHLCVAHSHEMPFLKAIVDRYAETLKSVDRDQGAYKLHLNALNMEFLFRSQETYLVGPDNDRSFDPSLIIAMRSLMTAHAGLISFFPGVRRFTEELNKYRAQSLALDSLQFRLHDFLSSDVLSSDVISEEIRAKLVGERILYESLKLDEFRKRRVPRAKWYAVTSTWFVSLARLFLSISRFFSMVAQRLF